MIPIAFSPVVALAVLVGIVALLLLSAALTKLFMRLVFSRIVWFWLVMLATVITMVMVGIVDYFLGYAEPGVINKNDMVQRFGIGLALQVAVFTIIVPDTSIRFISPLKWFLVIMIVGVLFVGVFVLIFFALSFLAPSVLEFQTALNRTRFV